MAVKMKNTALIASEGGNFTLPNATLSQMIEKLVSMHDQMGHTEAEARKMANENLPKLKRWAK